MSNTITGKVLSIGQPLQIPSRDPSKPFYKREMVIDCTRHDPYTGERSTFENTPMLEFAGDNIHMLDDILPGDIVTVHIDIVGTRYTDKATQQPRIFTRVRPYKVERIRTAQQPQQAFGQQAAPQPYAQQPYAQQPYAQPQPQQDLFPPQQPYEQPPF